MRTIIYLILTFGLISCNNTADDVVPIDKVIYDVCVAIKENKKDAFKSYFDPTSLNRFSISQVDYVFNNASAVASNYDLPSFEIWKKDRTFFDNDTVKNIICVGLPFIAKATSAAPEYYFKIGYDSRKMLTGFNLQKMTTFEDMPDRMFPNQKENFEFITDDLIEIKVYFLPGQNSDSEKAKTVEFKKELLTEKIRTDFKPFLEKVNSSEIVSSKKGAVGEQTNTNDLKAVIFTFKDGNDELTLSVLSPTTQDKFIELTTFYSLNAAILYQISDKDKTSIQKLLDEFIGKYLK